MDLPAEQCLLLLLGDPVLTGMLPTSSCPAVNGVGTSERQCEHTLGHFTPPA